jgi:hypothetical protein
MDCVLKEYVHVQKDLKEMIVHWLLTHNYLVEKIAVIEANVTKVISKSMKSRLMHLRIWI